MALKNGQFEVILCHRSDIAKFIEKHHYSGSINGVKSSFHFALVKADQLIGAILYGELGMANAWKKYADDPKDVIELRRLCLIDDTPKNAESFFIGATLRWLKKNTQIKIVVSYADKNYGHSGAIYRASNFDFVGMTQPSKMIVWNGRQYHDKAIRTKYNGELKPFAKKLKEALEAKEAQLVTGEQKYIYTRRLK